MKKEVHVFGGGLVGSLISIMLADRGLEVSLFEKREDLREVRNWEEGRSINLAMSDRGWRALNEIGLKEQVKKIGMPMFGRLIHNEDGNDIFQPYGKEGEAIYSVSRGKLNEILLDHSEKYSNIQRFFKHRCLEVNLKNSSTLVFDEVSKEEKVLKTDMILGADGAFSSVRGALQKTNRFNYSQQYIEHAYKELTIPIGKNQDWQLRPDVLHIWPRGRFMLIALPNTDGTFTCTLFLDFEGETSFENLQTEKDLMAFFYKHFPDTIALMPNLAEEFFKNPTASLVNIKCYPWAFQDKVALIGDAAHAIVPFYGQGMNSGFEDCYVLNEYIKEYPNDWQTILEKYQKSRKPNADAIADLAMQNFVEMRDLVADPKFLLRKKIEKYLHKNYPEYWTPLYSMVTFSQVPYAEALRVGKEQDKIMQKIMSIDDIENTWQNLNYTALLNFQKTIVR